MSLLFSDDRASTLPAPAGVIWAEVDTGFWVASRDGEYFGCVDAVEGGFVARDHIGSPIGRYDTWEAARASVRTTTHPANEEERRRREAVPAIAATVAGSVAVLCALTAGALLPLL